MAALTEANRIVVKIGSALLVERSSGALRQDWLASLAEDVAGFRAKGVDVVIVSSGSIALGRSVLGLGAAELTLEQSQAAAAVGQIQLARAYEQHLAPHGVIAGAGFGDFGRQRRSPPLSEFTRHFGAVVALRRGANCQ
jgi:glutamate 5-kinase